MNPQGHPSEAATAQIGRKTKQNKQDLDLGALNRKHSGKPKYFEGPDLSAVSHRCYSMRCYGSSCLLIGLFKLIMISWFDVVNWLLEKVFSDGGRGRGKDRVERARERETERVREMQRERQRERKRERWREMF